MKPSKSKHHSETNTEKIKFKPPYVSSYVCLKKLSSMKTRVHTKFKSDKTGNVCIKVTFRCVRVTTAAVEKQEVLHSLSVTAAALYCHL